MSNQGNYEALVDVATKLEALRSEMIELQTDWLKVNNELLAEREMRTNAQIERDQYRALLVRVLAVDEACTGEAYAGLIADLRKVIGAK